MRRIAVIGLGYAGLPVAVAFARRFPDTLGFDVDDGKVARLARGIDRSGQVAGDALRASGLVVTTDAARLAAADFLVVCVPTPIDSERRPDLSALRTASRAVGAGLRRGDVVVYQSTVYPGVTEGVCLPILEETSGLACGVDFGLGYAPERINPGDPEHGFERVCKLVAAADGATLDLILDVYGSVLEVAPVPVASIKLAEAAKLVENVQRDLNIALMNELALICDRLELDTRSVLEAAATKWNFHRYRPGLVGGHCIGVDPFYLTARARELGLEPEVILAGRRTNDRMGEFVAAKTLELLGRAGRRRPGARVAVLGVAFKAEVADPRNSRVPDVVRSLRGGGAEVLVHDPLVDPGETAAETGLSLVPASDLTDLDAVVLAVPHRGLDRLALRLAAEVRTAVLVDVMWKLDPADVDQRILFWRL